MRKFGLYDILSRIWRWLTRKPYPLHCNEDIQPFFIIGSGRSGTTLLRRMLVASEQVHIPPETYVLSQVIYYYRRNACQDWRDLVRECMALFEMHPEFDTFQITLRPLLPKLRAIPKEQRSLAKMLDMFYTYHAEQTGMPTERWGDKTPINTFALDDIYAIFPKAQFIHLLRDGVDVVDSYVSTGLITDVSQAARHWCNAVECVEAFSHQHSQACLELRYERLSCYPDKEMQRVCTFLGVDYKESMLDKLTHTSNMGDMKAYAHYQHANETVSSQYMGKGRKRLSKEVLQHMASIMDKRLKATGYDSC